MLLGPVNARGASFLEMIMEVLASQMQYETQELLKERYIKLCYPVLCVVSEHECGDIAE